MKAGSASICGPGAQQHIIYAAFNHFGSLAAWHFISRPSQSTHVRRVEITEVVSNGSETWRIFIAAKVALIKSTGTQALVTIVIL